MNKRDWIFIDKDKKRTTFITPLPPLSYHLETGE